MSVLSKRTSLFSFLRQLTWHCPHPADARVLLCTMLTASGAAIDQPLLAAGPTAAKQWHAAAGWDRWTDRWMPDSCTDPAPHLCRQCQ